MIDQQLQDSLKAKLLEYKIEEFDVIDNDPEIWIQIVFLEEETFEYLMQSVNCLDYLTLNILRDFDCKVLISESKGIHSILGKFKKKFVHKSYNYYNKPSTYYNPSPTKLKNYEEEEEEGSDYPDWQDLKDLNSKYLITTDTKNKILSSKFYKELIFSQTEIEHISRIIEDRIPSEIVHNFKGPYKSNQNGNSYFWNTPSRVITLYKLAAPIDSYSREARESGGVYNFYLIKLAPRDFSQTNWFLCLNIAELRKFKF